MSCPCDETQHPAASTIPAGLAALPRQVAGFAEFRAAMLRDLRREPSLDGWRARSAGDLGMMLLEMWAVLCDAVSFYDQVHADEAYPRTAKLEPSVRGLMALLGYVPRPAVAAEVELTVLLEGRKPVLLPAGTAFRSGAFGSEAPQVFELVRDVLLHPAHNRLRLVPKRPSTASEAYGTLASPNTLHLSPKGATVRTGDVVLFYASGSANAARARTVIDVETIDESDGAKYTRVKLGAWAPIPASTPLTQLRLLRATQKTGLWTMPYEAGSENPIAADYTKLVLDGVHRQFRVGQRIVVERSAELRSFKIMSVSEVQQKIRTGTDGEGNSLYAWLPATRLTLDVSLNDASRRETGNLWGTLDYPLVTVHHGLSFAGKVTAPASATIAPADPLKIEGGVPSVDEVAPPERFALADAEEKSLLVSGALDETTDTLAIESASSTWTTPLTTPVEVRANVVSAIRRETVAREVLGSGDASLANQRFILKKSPLTYVASASPASATGLASTLEVWVDGVKWREVRSFFGTKPEDPIYVVRLDPEGVATVTFGDGVHGARLPSGTANVVARYAYGAGEASPPAGSIHQLARPVKGLSSVAQPADATGGADAEPPEQVRTYAPRSALVLGRAVSILDMNALAATVPGVRAVETAWAWQGAQQRPVVRCWYAGEPSPGAVEDRLRAMSDEVTPIAASPAQALPALLALQVAIDPAYESAAVLEEVFEVLAAETTGLLRPERLGIGVPLYRSRVTAAVLSVPGARAIHFSGMLWIDRSGALKSFLHDGYGASPGMGAYFDFEHGFVYLNGEFRRLG